MLFSDFDAAWTGFYASHGRLKGLARSSQATLHAAEGLFTLYNYPQAGFNATLNKTALLETLKGLRKASAEVNVNQWFSTELWFPCYEKSL